MDHISPKNKPKLRGHYAEIPFISVTPDVQLGTNVQLSQFVNLYSCSIGDETKVGAFTEIGRDVCIGRRCKIGAFVFIPEGVTIGNNVFIGPGTIFTNDKYPTAHHDDWVCLNTNIHNGAVIGAGCVILPGITIGENAFIGAGARVLSDVAPNARYREVIESTTTT